MTFSKIRIWAAIIVGQLVATSASLAQSSSILTPEPGSTLPAGSVTFTWEDTGSDYLLYVGTSPGSSNIYNGNEGTSTSATVSGIPSGSILHVRLWTSTAPGSNRYFVRDYRYNTDIDNDGIEDLIDQNPGSSDAKQVFGGVDHTLTLLGSGRVANLQVSEELYDAMAGGGATSARMRQLTNMVLGHLDDDFDFMFLISDQDSVPSGAYFGIHYSVKNDISGLGKSIFDNGGLYGSSGELESVIHLTSSSGLRNGPSLHELMHRWANSLDSVPSVIGGHWGYCSVGGQLGGWAEGTLTNNGDGTYSANNGRPGSTSFGGNANGGNSIPYSDFELYMMGLIPATGLPDITIANDFNFVGAGTFTTSGFTTVSMADVIATDGARSPDHTTSQKNFRAIAVVLTKAPLPNGRWASYDRDVYDFSLNGDEGTSSYNFWEATGGRATLQMDGLLVPPPTGTMKLTINGSDIEVSFKTEIGETYRLERSGNLKAPWTPVESGIIGDGSSKSSTHTGGANFNSMFYRIIRE